MAKPLFVHSHNSTRTNPYCYWVILHLILQLRATNVSPLLSVATWHNSASPYATSLLDLGPFGPDLAITAGLNDSSNPSLFELTE